MRLATHSGGRIGLVDGGHLIDVTATLDSRLPDNGLSLMRRLISSWPQAADILRNPRGERHLIGEVTLDAPVPDPTKIIAAPVNYRDHQAEMSQESYIDALGVFLKAPTSALGHQGAVRLPYYDRRFDHEAELALVIAHPTRNVSAAHALDHVFGYTALLDITMRGGEDRSTRKSFDTFTPMGPWLVTADEFGSPDDVTLELTVNGQTRQKANTGDLIWGVAELISYASSVMTLLPGDVITTGTPAGVGPIVDGDQVELIVERIGWLAVNVSADSAVACPTTGADRGPVPPPPPARPAAAPTPFNLPGNHR